MCYVCAFQEAVYERKLSRFITSLLIKNAHLERQKNGTPLRPPIQWVLSPWPFDNLWFCRVHENCLRDVDFEVHRRMPPRGVVIFIG